MAKLIALSKLKLTQARYTKPNIRNYNRLEGSPRSDNFEQNLAMPAHDPLWFLCRQWQFGEFKAEDAATAYQASVLGVHSTPGELELANGKKIPYDISQPLEAVVEKRKITPTLRLRAQMGRHLVHILSRRGLKNYASLIASDFPLDTTVKSDDEEGVYFAKALSASLGDGYAVYERIANETFSEWYENHDEIDAADHEGLEEVRRDFETWFTYLYQQPGEGESAWLAGHLEHSFSLVAKDEERQARRLVADQFASGHLDWEDFDQETKPADESIENLQEPEEVVQTFIPSELAFSGMPHPRLWQMEDHEIDFGKLNASPTSIMNVLLAEYGLNYSNDWFVLPYELPLNTLCKVKGILLTDVFGQHIHIKPAIKDPETNWQQFTMFHQTERDNETQGESIFFLVPAIGQKQESEDLEKVNFIRDEMSNMVWAIEQVVPSDAGRGRMLKRNIPSIAKFEPVGEDAEIRYVLGNTVPDNWIPFIPVHRPVTGDEIPREIRLQRARMPRSPGAQGPLLTEEQPVYFVEEQEVLRAGIIIADRYQRTRWLNGKTFLWRGRQKSAGRGEGMANLMFDRVINFSRSDQE